jgi:hypothetical protein
MSALHAFAHAFVIWMPVIVMVPCVWIWAALIRGEQHNRDDEIIGRREQLSLPRGQTS